MKEPTATVYFPSSWTRQQCVGWLWDRGLVHGCNFNWVVSTGRSWLAEIKQLHLTLRTNAKIARFR